MHTLESMLVLLAKRIQNETGNEELADAAGRLASGSHDYQPPGGEDRLSELAEEWSRRYGHLMYSGSGRKTGDQG